MSCCKRSALFRSSWLSSHSMSFRSRSNADLWAQRRFPDEVFQKRFGFLCRETLGFPQNLRRHPLGIRREMVHVLAGGRVFLAYLGQLVGVEMTCQLDDGGPEPPMHKGHTPRDESAHQDVGRIAELLQDGKDLMTFSMAPPTSLDGFTRNRFRKARRGTLGGYEDDAVPSHECHRRIRVHLRVAPVNLPIAPK